MIRLSKILLLIALFIPFWITIVAFASEIPPVQQAVTEDELFKEKASKEEVWREHINQELMKREKIRIQITELLQTPDLDRLTDKHLAREMRLDIPRLRTRGVNDITIRYVTESGALDEIFKLRAKVFVQRKVPVATRSLAQGSLIESDSIENKWIDASSINQGVADSSAIIGRSVRSFIGAGQVIYSNKLKSQTLIEKGDRVSVQVIGQGIQISAMGVAQEAGQRGQTIRLMNLESKREIYATVTGPKSAEVRL